MTQGIFIPVALMAGLLCGACAQQVSQDAAAETETVLAELPKVVVLDAPFATVKPGAGVSFTETISGEGRRGTVDLQVEEYYETGTLTLEAYGEDGLSVFGASRTASIDMASGVVHDWSVNYEAEADGVYYLNIQAMAEPEGQPMARRAHSVRIEIGDFTPGAEKVQMGEVQADPSGDLIVVMEAEETIE